MRRAELFFTVIVLLGAFNHLSAQEKIAESVLTNSGVVELVKAGLAESIILTKIKNSKCEFDTSSNALVKLKEFGVSDTIVMAMIEAKPEANISPDTETILELKDANGKRKIFVESEDERSLIEINKELKKNGFEITANEKSADLILKFDFQIHSINVGFTPGLVGGVYMGSTAEQKNGKLRVFLKNGSTEQIIFVKERRPSTVGKLIHKQAQEFTAAFVKELKKSEAQVLPNRK